VFSRGPFSFELQVLNSTSSTQPASTLLRCRRSVADY
jgi:hypothetical protein